MSHDELKSLVGEVLTHVDQDPEGEQIMLTTQSGRTIRIYHEQECCESVHIEDTEGKWHELIGKVVVDAEAEEVEQDVPQREFCDSWTRTALTFRVDGATVISRWIGESNGYYSESVDIADITA